MRRFSDTNIINHPQETKAKLDTEALRTHFVVFMQPGRACFPLDSNVDKSAMHNSLGKEAMQAMYKCCVRICEPSLLHVVHDCELD